MPRYEYKCADCNLNKEVVRSFSDADLVELCEKCNNPMNKVYNTFGIQFKGGGFYSTGG
jgi:putative FmdB family regulatory protein